MITEILSEMTEIVASRMTSFQSDFEKHDRRYIEAATLEQFPMLWVVGVSHTYLLKLGEYKKDFFAHEHIRYAYASGDDTFSFYLRACRSDALFLIDAKGVNEISVSQAEKVVEGTVSAAVSAWLNSGHSLPDDIKMPIKFYNITFEKLKELIADCRKHDDSSLTDIFRGFRNYRRSAANQFIEINYNSRYNEFAICQFTNDEPGLAGGIIFHGWPESGYKTNGSVQLNPRYGWAMHT